MVSGYSFGNVSQNILGQRSNNYVDIFRIALCCKITFIKQPLEFVGVNRVLGYFTCHEFIQIFIIHIYSENIYKKVGALSTFS